MLRFLIGDVADGNGEIVRRTLAAARIYPDGRTERAPAASLFDVVPPTEQIQPVAGAGHPGGSRRPTPNWSCGHGSTCSSMSTRTPEPNANTSQPSRRTSSSGPSTRCSPRRTQPSSRPKMRRTAASKAPTGGSARPNSSRTQHEQRRRQRLEETERGRNVVRGDVTVIGSALLLPLPHPDDAGSGGSGSDHGRSDDEIEQIAVRIARQYETDRGATVQSVEQDHVGFDLLSLRGLERRCIEVKGRAGVARVELTWSEFAKSQELGDDYWLYVVLDCATPVP